MGNDIYFHDLQMKNQEFDEMELGDFKEDKRLLNCDKCESTQ